MAEARYRDGMRVMLPLTPAIVAFGASFGVLARAAGVDSLAALVMSATTFAGSAQFAVVSVLGAGGTAAAAIGAAVLLNARYAPMALAASGAFRGGPVRRLLEAQLLVDESWALSSRGDGFDIKVLLGAGAILYVGWNAGTAIGVIAGDSLGDPATLGLDAAFPALFLALLAPLLRSNGRVAVAAALIGAATIALKAAGPVLAAGRQLPEGASRVVDLLAPALLAALVATQAFTTDEELVLDERAAGLLAGGVAILLRAPLLVVVVAAAATAAALRAIP